MKAAYPLAVAALAALLALVAIDGGTEQRTRTLAVQATVQTVSSLPVLSQPERLQVTADDVSRGWVDVPGVMTVVVSANDRAGWVLDVATAPGPFTEIVLDGPAGATALPPTGGAVAQPWLGNAPTTVVYGVRFGLAPGTEPMSMAWPLSLRIRPL